MPPAGFLARKPAIGEASPSGCKSSILVFGSSTKTTVTPCSGSSCGSPTAAPSVSRYCAAAAARSGTAIATWFRRPIIDVLPVRPRSLGPIGAADKGQHRARNGGVSHAKFRVTP